jgi:heme-degrading monooxygenase HmoA
MIARIWRGAVRSGDGDAYEEYIWGTGMQEYGSTPGNRGAWMLRRTVPRGTGGARNYRTVGENEEFVTLSLWDSLDAVRAFAGDDYERAVFYPEDDRYLVERDLKTTHYQVARHVPGAPS